MKYGSGLKSERGGWGDLTNAFTYHEAAERTPTHPQITHTYTHTPDYSSLNPEPQDC